MGGAFELHIVYVNKMPTTEAFIGHRQGRDDHVARPQ
jgi:hypothetical protein